MCLLLFAVSSLDIYDHDDSDDNDDASDDDDDAGGDGQREGGVFPSLFFVLLFLLINVHVSSAKHCSTQARN